MEAALIRQVWKRASSRCEYCRMSQEFDEVTFEVDHIIARKHGGSDEPDNLCLACFFCNAHKGANLSGIDPISGKITPLFHPRRQNWGRHFAWRGAVLLGRTASGRATIAVLNMNDPYRIELRDALICEGVFPPS
jgi:hypothetical protein